MTKKIIVLFTLIIVALTAAACEPEPGPEPVLSLISPSNSAAPRGDRTLSIDITEAADGDYEAAVIAAQSLGVQATSLTVYWDEIETAPGVFHPDPNWLTIANLYYPSKNMGVSLAVSVIDTINLRIPADLSGRPMDDPEVIARFNAVLDYVVSQIPDLDLVSLAIGNEIDIYLGTDAVHWAAYETFFEQTAAHARKLLPGVPVGTKATFDGLTGPPAPYLRSINMHADLLLVTYYPLQEDFSVRYPETVHADFQALVGAYPERPIHVLEVGYPSGAENRSSPALQAAFIRELFLAWDQHAADIPLISYTWLTDMSADSVEWMAGYYGLADPRFFSYLATLGIREPGGENKPAFEQFAEESAARGW